MVEQNGIRLRPWRADDVDAIEPRDCDPVHWMPAGSVLRPKTFETWREGAERANPRVLLLSLDDVLTGERGLALADYPDEIVLHGTKVPVTYRFDPAADDDGITLTVPLLLLPQLEPGELDWTIPGWHQEKIAALLYELPKALRRELGDIPRLARTIATELTPFRGPMLKQLAQALVFQRQLLHL